MSVDVPQLARRIRRHVLRMVSMARASHVGGCMSVADILAVVFGDWLRGSPDEADRDRFILSKGHAAAALYATLAECGYIPIAELDQYLSDGSRLLGHASHLVPGVELSTGSLGHGLSVGCGLALAARQTGSPSRAIVLLSDGELNEGSVWEAAMFAGHHRLESLLAIVDVNGWQSFGRTSDVLNLEPLADKWTAFGWAVRQVDGHDTPALIAALNTLPFSAGRPSILLAKTVKGKGVSFMEDSLAWHYRSPDAAMLKTALAELEGGP
ncbi:MAG: transketolase [Gemmataceae bacterium]|nr:transketolase [Gemmataceae bacterium]